MGQQPPNHYELLGISPLENDKNVIEVAIMRQSARVRVHQAESPEQTSKQTLERLLEAGRVLLDPIKRRQYDEQLRQQGQPVSGRPGPAPPAPPAPLITSSLVARAAARGRGRVSGGVAWRWLRHSLPWEKVLAFGLALIFFISGLALFAVVLLRQVGR
jgi:hypothetical protein